MPLIGRTEAEVSAQLAALLVGEGHHPRQLRHRGQWAQCGQPPPRARPDGSSAAGETVVCDFGGAFSVDGDVGYCSDITRTVVTGAPSAEISGCYRGAGGGPAGARWRRPGPGVTAEHVDRVARDIIEAAGFGELFVHRTGHGIGIEEHEDPYLVSGNAGRAASGSRLLDRAGHLPGRAVRHAARGHRGHRRGRRARAAQRGRARPGRASTPDEVREGRWTWESRERWRWWRQAPAGSGRATAEALAGEGVRVMVSSRDEESLAAMARRCGPPGPTWRPWRPTSPLPDAPARLVEATVEAFGSVWTSWSPMPAARRPAGHSRSTTPMVDRRALNANLLSAVRLARGAVPVMRGPGVGADLLHHLLLGGAADPDAGPVQHRPGRTVGVGQDGGPGPGRRGDGHHPEPALCPGPTPPTGCASWEGRG